MLAERGIARRTRSGFSRKTCASNARAPTHGSFRFGFQTKFTPPPEDALEIAYDHFFETDARIVFYRLGAVPGKSVCILLVRPTGLRKKIRRDGYVRRDEWKISFYPGHAGDIEEVTDLTRWVRRVQPRPRVSRFGFLHGARNHRRNAKLHGRPLLPYERFAADDDEPPETDPRPGIIFFARLFFVVMQWRDAVKFPTSRRFYFCSWLSPCLSSNCL